jgi:hypothetical protein
MKKMLMIAILCLLTGLPSLAYALNGGGKTIAVTGTAVALSSTRKTERDIIMRAYATNSAVIYIGGSDVSITSKNGMPLSAGDPHYVDVDTLSNIYINGTANDGVGYTYK